MLLKGVEIAINYKNYYWSPSEITFNGHPPVICFSIIYPPTEVNLGRIKSNLLL